MRLSPPGCVNCRCQSCMPFPASMLTTCSRFCVYPELADTNTRPSTITGPDTPRPGKAAFHAIVEPLSSVGSDSPDATEFASLPRNCFQSPARNDTADNTPHTTAKITDFATGRIIRHPLCSVPSSAIHHSEPPQAPEARPHPCCHTPAAETDTFAPSPESARSDKS